MENDTSAATGETGKSPLALQKIFLKDCSFESPNAPAIYSEPWQPQISLNMHTNTALLAENVHEVVLHATVEAKLGDKTAFLIEVEQAGIFQLEIEDDDALKAALAARCPEMLYPYVRELVASMALKGGFPQILLQPMNFEELYARAGAGQSAAG